MGGAIGVAIFGAVFTGQLQVWLPRAAHAEAVAHAISAVFLVATPVAALAFLVVLFLREYPLRSAAQVQKPARLQS